MKSKKLVSFHKEIDLIQSCITRMANNSFRIKGWYISLISLVTGLLLGQNVDHVITGVFLIVITCVFWSLDTYFLYVERLFRLKYDWVVKSRLSGNDDYLYDLNPNNKSTICKDVEVKSKSEVAWSSTLRPLYLFAIIAGVAFMVCGVLKLCGCI